MQKTKHFDFDGQCGIMVYNKGEL